MRILMALVLVTAVGCMGTGPGLMQNNDEIDATNARVAQLEQQMAGMQQYIAGLYAALLATGALTPSQLPPGTTR